MPGEALLLQTHSWPEVGVENTILVFCSLVSLKCQQWPQIKRNLEKRTALRGQIRHFCEMSGSKEKDGRKIFLTWKSSSTVRFLDLTVIRSFLPSSPPEWCLSCLYFILLVLLLWKESPILIKNKIWLKFMQGNMFCICYSIRVTSQIQNCRRIPYQESCYQWIGSCTSSDTHKKKRKRKKQH